VVRDQGARLTFAGLRVEADRLAAGLIALGLKPGDRAAIWSPNRWPDHAPTSTALAINTIISG
jgi:acyl-CoA synthetase (AMP-forming)/AMP-acid ligase II